MQNTLHSYLNNPLRPITFTIVGAGGTGSLFIQELGRIAAAYALLHPDDPNKQVHAMVFDADEVAEHNIGRQLFAPCDIHQNKAEVAVSRINRFYGFNWVAIPEHFKLPTRKKSDPYHYNPGVNFLQAASANFLVTCTDSAKSRKLADTFFKAAQKEFMQKENNNHECWPLYWIDIGNTKATGQIIVGDTLNGWPTIIDLHGVQEERLNDEPSCSIAMSLGRQDLHVNSFAAKIAAKWVWEALSSKDGTIGWRGAYFNTDTLNIRKIKTNAQKEDAEGAPQPGFAGSHGKERTDRPAANRKRKDGHRALPRRSRRSAGQEEVLRPG